MSVRATIAALGGVVCLALVLVILPSTNDGPTSLLQGVQKDVLRYDQAKSTLGKELAEADALTLKVPSKQAKKVLLTATNKISKEAHILSTLENRVKRRAIVDHKEAQDEPLAMHAVEERAKSDIAMIKKEKTVAHEMYLSAVKKLQLEQIKAKAMIQKQAQHAHKAKHAKPPTHVAPAAAVRVVKHAQPPAAHAVKLHVAKKTPATVHPAPLPAAAHAHSGKPKLPLSRLYNTPLVAGSDSYVKHCAVDGGAGCGYPPDVDTFEHGTPHKAVEKPVGECIPPMVLDEEKDMCVDDPRSRPEPKMCREQPFGSACHQYHMETAAASKKHMNTLRDTYPYRYHTHWYNPGDSHTIHPQRYPHKDGSDLGDNYISGWEDSHKPGSQGGTFADHMSNAINLKSNAPLTFVPFMGDTDDLRAPPTSEHLKAPIAAMERRNPLYSSFIHDDVVPIDHYHKMLWRYAKRTRPTHKDTFRGKMGDHVVKGFADGRVDPFGLNDGLKDDEQPAMDAFNHHKYLAYGRKLEKEPITDMAINGWHGQHGVPPMVENSPEAGGDEGGAAAGGGPACAPDPPTPDNPHGSVCIDGVKFWQGKEKWCIRFCLPKGNPDAQYEYELLGHPPTAKDLEDMNAGGVTM